VTIVVRPAPGSPPLPALEDWQATPLSARKCLPPREYAARHGPATVDLEAVKAFAQAQGLTVLESHAGRCNVVVGRPRRR
jgi:hypothetical protein